MNMKSFNSDVLQILRGNKLTDENEGKMEGYGTRGGMYNYTYA